MKLKRTFSSAPLGEVVLWAMQTASAVYAAMHLDTA